MKFHLKPTSYVFLSHVPCTVASQQDTATRKRPRSLVALGGRCCPLSENGFLRFISLLRCAVDVIVTFGQRRGERDAKSYTRRARGWGVRGGSAVSGGASSGDVGLGWGAVVKDIVKCSSAGSGITRREYKSIISSSGT